MADEAKEWVKRKQHAVVFRTLAEAENHAWQLVTEGS